MVVPEGSRGSKARDSTHWGPLPPRCKCRNAHPGMGQDDKSTRLGCTMPKQRSRKLSCFMGRRAATQLRTCAVRRMCQLVRSRGSTRSSVLARTVRGRLSPHRVLSPVRRFRCL